MIESRPAQWCRASVLLLLLAAVSYVVGWSASETTIRVPDKAMVGNPDTIVRPPQGFEFDSVDHPDYDALLRPRVRAGMDAMWGSGWSSLPTWERASRLRIWLRQYLDFGEWHDYEYGTDYYTGRDNYVNSATIADNIAWHDAGSEGGCGYYADMFVSSALVLGMEVRRVGWYSPAWSGDQLVEVYVPEEGSWAALSPMFNVWFSGPSGQPLSVIEMCDLVHLGKTDQVRQEYDDALLALVTPDPAKPWQSNEVTHTAPHGDPILDFSGEPVLVDGRPMQLKDASWDVYIAGASGYEYVRDPRFRRYVSGPGWPYAVDPSLVSFDRTSDPGDFDFDAQGILIDEVLLAGSTARVVIGDYFMPNMRSFIIVSYDESGRLLDRRSAEAPWIGRRRSLEVEYAPDGRLEVWAENLRGGRSNTITVDLSSLPEAVAQ